MKLKTQHAKPNDFNPINGTATLRIQILNELANGLYVNKKHNEGDSGLDLFAISGLSLMPEATEKIKFGIACEMVDRITIWEDEKPKEIIVHKPFYVVPRSSISKTPLRMSNSVGIIDSGYRGEIMGSVDNIGKNQYIVQPGDRLFQIVSADLSPFSVEVVKELSTTERGRGGFGSTGK